MDSKLDIIETKDIGIDSAADSIIAARDRVLDCRAGKWRQELKKHTEITGVSLGEVCEYIGIEPSDYPGFYRKLPRSRETYIGIGMAYRQPAETINRWITGYGSKRALYIKDIFEDMIWLYLINANINGGGYPKTYKNYYQEFEATRTKIEEIYNEIWNQDIIDSIGTIELEDDFRYIEYDDEYFALKRFVCKNIDSFKTAYARPRKTLNKYVSSILETKNKNVASGRKWTLNTLRGYLDDSMINYLSGSSETINSYDKAKGCHTSGIKHVPRNKKAHISLCLALGMTAGEIDIYLEMMGYAPLDYIDRHESTLIDILKMWDDMHPLQRRYKEKYIFHNTEQKLSETDELRAVNEMLQLRSDLKDIYEARSISTSGGKDRFPYMND